MNNWWIASLEHFGLVTHEEALHISSQIKNSIHKDNYEEALDEFKAIMSKSKGGSTLLNRIETDIALVKAEVAQLKKPIAQSKKS